MVFVPDGYFSHTAPQIGHVDSPLVSYSDTGDIGVLSLSSVKISGKDHTENGKRSRWAKGYNNPPSEEISFPE